MIDPPHRKVEENNQPIPSHPIAREIYEKRICNRYPNDTGNEYLFFNNETKRGRNLFKTLSSKKYVTSM